MWQIITYIMKWTFITLSHNAALLHNAALQGSSAPVFSEAEVEGDGAELKHPLLPLKMCGGECTDLLHHSLVLQLHRGRKKALQRVVKSAQKTTGCSFVPLSNNYISRCTDRTTCIMRDLTHPAHGLFCPLPSGRRLRSIRSRSTRWKQLLPGCCQSAKHLNNAAPLIAAWF